jgi:hypothetical protein
MMLQSQSAVRVSSDVGMVNGGDKGWVGAHESAVDRHRKGTENLSTNSTLIGQIKYDCARARACVSAHRWLHTTPTSTTVCVLTSTSTNVCVWHSRHERAHG